MKRAILLFICSLSNLIVHGQEPEPPTQEWCEWAFTQLPQDRELSKVDSTAFSAEFYELLKKAIETEEWDRVHFPDIHSDWNPWTHWYSGITGPLHSDVNTILTTEVLPVNEKRTTVVYTIQIIQPFPPNKHQNYRMPIVYENGAWRIDDWNELGLEYWESRRELAEMAIYFNEEKKRLLENRDSTEHQADTHRRNR